MNTQEINPILVLAGATAKVGCSIFASQLVNADTGITSATAVIESNPYYRGLSAVSVGWILDSELKRNDMYVPPDVDIDG